MPDTELIVETYEPSLLNIMAVYATSSNEVVIQWQINNKSVGDINTSVRYDTVSHSTSIATSDSYPQAQVLIRIDTGFEARIKITDEEKIFYRIQLSQNDEFLWSDEGIILIVG